MNWKKIRKRAGPICFYIWHSVFSGYRFICMSWAFHLFLFNLWRKEHDRPKDLRCNVEILSLYTCLLPLPDSSALFIFYFLTVSYIMYYNYIPHPLPSSTLSWLRTTLFFPPNSYTIRENGNPSSRKHWQSLTLQEGLRPHRHPLSHKGKLEGPA